MGGKFLFPSLPFFIPLSQRIYELSIAISPMMSHRRAETIHWICVTFRENWNAYNIPVRINCEFSNDGVHFVIAWHFYDDALSLSVCSDGKIPRQLVKPLAGVVNLGGSTSSPNRVHYDEQKATDCVWVISTAEPSCCLCGICPLIMGDQVLHQHSVRDDRYCKYRLVV